MPTYVLRVRLPDRPGALGAVASRIGAVRGDVVAVDILDRGSTTAVDEIAVELPSAELVALLVAEIEEVDGVGVEEVLPCAVLPHDLVPAVFEATAAIVDCDRDRDVFDVLTTTASEVFAAEWATVAGATAHGVVAGKRLTIRAVDGGRAGLVGGDGADVIEVQLDGAHELVAARPGLPFRTREREHLHALAAIAGRRLRQLDAQSRERSTARVHSA